jgi:TctA family transporter
MPANDRPIAFSCATNPTVLVTRPISLAFIIITAIVLVVMVAPAIKKRRGEIAG